VVFVSLQYKLHQSYVYVAVYTCGYSFVDVACVMGWWILTTPAHRQHKTFLCFVWSVIQKCGNRPEFSSSFA